MCAPLRWTGQDLDHLSAGIGGKGSVGMAAGSQGSQAAFVSLANNMGYSLLQSTHFFGPLVRGGAGWVGEGWGVRWQAAGRMGQGQAPHLTLLLSHPTTQPNKLNPNMQPTQPNKLNPGKRPTQPNKLNPNMQPTQPNKLNPNMQPTQPNKLNPNMQPTQPNKLNPGKRPTQPPIPCPHLLPPPPQVRSTLLPSMEMMHELVFSSRIFFDSPRGRWWMNLLCELVFIVIYEVLAFNFQV